MAADLKAINKRTMPQSANHFRASAKQAVRDYKKLQHLEF
jgi:hypothetical protein